MSPYAIFAAVVSEDPQRSFRDVWEDFACWETTRQFVDDPNSQSKEAIAWIRSLDELAVRLGEYQDPGKERCLNALEAAAVAFACIDHGPQLYEAVNRWREFRQAERSTT